MASRNPKDLIEEIDTLADEYVALIKRHRLGQVSETEVWESEQMLLGTILAYKRRPYDDNVL